MFWVFLLCIFGVALTKYKLVALTKYKLIVEVTLQSKPVLVVGTLGNINIEIRERGKALAAKT